MLVTVYLCTFRGFFVVVKVVHSWENHYLRCYTNELGRTAIYVMKLKEAWPEEAIHVKILRAGCGQEEPGSIMRVKLATGCCHQAHRSKVLITSGT